MNRSMALLIAASLLAAPASAQVVDLSVITCKEFLDSGKESIGYIMMWLDGLSRPRMTDLVHAPTA